MYSKRQVIGNYILVIGTVLLLNLNWNTFELWDYMRNYNSIIVAVILGIYFLCQMEYKQTFADTIMTMLRDKLFMYVFILNVSSLVLLLIGNRGVGQFLPVFNLSMALYLSTKANLRIKDNKLLIIISALIGLFFIYWTIDVKGYFKGYSINYGGLVLLSGFLFIIILLEYLRFYSKGKEIIHRGAISIKISYVIVIIEIGMFIWGYKIISWYRSRTAFVAMIVFALFLIMPQCVLSNKIAYAFISVVTVLLGILFPFIYCFAGAKIDGLKNYNVFYKSVISDRFVIWPQLYELFKNFRITGIGTLYMNDSEPYRNGLLDTCSSFVDLYVVHGAIIGTMVIVLIIWTLLKHHNNVSESHFAKISYAGVMGLIVASYTESYITSAPFVNVFFLLTLYVNSFDEKKKETSLSVIVEAVSNRIIKVYYGIINFIFKVFHINDNQLKERFKITFITTFSVGFMYFIFAPIEVLFANRFEILVNLSSFIWIFVISVVVASLIFAYVSTILPECVSVIWNSLITGIGVASYIQYMFLNGKLISVVGEFVLPDKNDSRYTGSIIAYFAVLTVVAIICLIFKYRNSLYSYIALFFIFVQTVAIISLLIQYMPGRDNYKEYRVLDTATQFDIAPNDNIIVIMPDSMGVDIYSEIISQFPECENILHDFTYYKNTDSVYFPTYPSLVHVLTDEPYDEAADLPRRDLYESRAFQSEKAVGFYDTLHNNGYSVMPYCSEILAEDYLKPIFDNYKQINMHTDYALLIGFMCKQSLYRYLPFNIKPYFEWNNNDIKSFYYSNDYKSYTQNHDAYNKLCESGLKINEKFNNLFSFHYYIGAHLEPTTDENLKEVPMNGATIYQAGAGFLKYADSYFEELKRIGKYDDSVIIVMGDHGLDDGISNPAFFVKDRYEQHDTMILSDDSIRYCDFTDYILKKLK